MLCYSETMQKRVLREMERDLMALLAVDIASDGYEVIYSDGAYKDYQNRYQGKDFFEAWVRDGLPHIFDKEWPGRSAKNICSRTWRATIPIVLCAGS